MHLSPAFYHQSNNDQYLEQVTDEMSDFQAQCTKQTGFKLALKAPESDITQDEKQNGQMQREITQQLLQHFTRMPGYIEIIYRVVVEVVLPLETQLILRVQSTVMYVHKLSETISKLKNDQENRKLQAKEYDMLPALRELKENLDALLLFLERVVFLYTCNNDNKENMKIDQLIVFKKQVLSILYSLNLRNLKEVTNDEDALLCATLGLGGNCENSLRQLNDFSRSHKSKLYWIYNFMENQYLSLPELLDNGQRTLSLEQQLRWLGFTQSRSTVLANWISSSKVFKHRNLLYWAKQYIEVEQALYNGIFREIPFVFEPQNVGKPFQQVAQLGYDEDEKDQYVIVTCSNMLVKNRSEIIQKMDEMRSTYPFPENSTLLFHSTRGTDAYNIFNHGVRLEKGKPNCDFSNGYGFYLTYEVEFSLDYAWSKKGKDCLAILVFAGDNHFRDRYHGLELHSWQTDVCKKIVTYYKDESISMPKELRNIQYLEGPVSPAEGEYAAQQLCLKDEAMADEFSKCLQCAFFFILA